MLDAPFPSRLLQEAVEAIGTLPGVGRRSALRLALHLLRQPSENVHHFTQAIDRLRDEAHYCRECMMIADGDVCSICSDRSRDRRLGPSDLTIRQLRDRVQAAVQAGTEIEVIMALSGDVEGETTAFYIYRQIEGPLVKVSSLARGLGFGDDLEYADSLTLGRSIAQRQIFKP